jgi:hypothetical protein
VSATRCPNRSPFAYVVQLALPRALVSARAVHALLERGVEYGVDAVTVSRSIWELAVQLEYMLGCTRHREELAARFIAQNIHARRRQADWLHGDGTSDPASKSAAERKSLGLRGDWIALIKLLARAYVTQGKPRRPAVEEANRAISRWKYKPTWSGLRIEQMAKAVRRPDRNRKWEYERAYPFLSESSHVSMGSLASLAAALHPRPGIPPFQASDPARLASSLSTIWLLQIMDSVAEHFGFPWRNQLTALSDAAVDQWARAGIVRRESGSAT